MIEQITYLLFIRRLDELQTLEEVKAKRLGRAVERRIFPAGADPKGRPYADLRWSRFKNMAPGEMFALVGEHVFPFLRTAGGESGTAYAHHMRDARFTVPTPALLARADGGPRHQVPGIHDFRPHRRCVSKSWMPVPSPGMIVKEVNQPGSLHRGMINWR